MTTDRAVQVALLATELVTNAAKHAYPEGKEGPIFVVLKRTDDDTIRLSVRDRGAGLATTFDVEHGVGLGIRIVNALVTQTGAKLSIHRHRPGSEFVIDMPLQAEAPARRQ
jgi:two-component sensor histidine kinase